MKKVCSVVGCISNTYCRGYCSKHYQELKRTGKLANVYADRGSNLPCKADGCKSSGGTNGFCSKHYQRFKKRGTWSDDDLKNDAHLTVRERLEKNKVITDLGCWEWQKRRDKDGYGVISIKNRPCRVPKVSYELHVGKVPKGLHILHKCDNPPCFNPDHLFLGTNADNMEDMKQKDRNNKGEEMHNAKLTDDMVREIKTRLANGETVNQIFYDYPVSGAALRNIKKGKTWKHITI